MATSTGDLSTISASDARDAFEAGISEMAVLVESAPASIEPSLTAIDVAYRTVQLELISLNWDTIEYLSTTAAKSQMARIASQDLAQAIAKVGVDASSRCKFDLEFNAETSDTLVTLPQPVVPDVSQPDITVEPTEGDSAVIAIGLVIAERYGLSLSDSEALCAGTRFNSTTVDGTMDETELDIFYRGILIGCGVVVP